MSKLLPKIKKKVSFLDQSISQTIIKFCSNNYLQPPEEWSPRVVSEWLAANNFFDVVDYFQNVDGSHLLNLDEQGIKVIMQ